MSRRRIQIALAGSVLVLVISLQWYFSGGYLPLGIAETESVKTRQELKKRFPEVDERAINSAMLQCDNANWIDWSEAVYERFVVYFKDMETYRKYQNTGECPPSFQQR